MISLRRFALLVACAAVLLSVFGCGGSGGGTPSRDGDGTTTMPVQCPDGTTVGNGMTCPPVQCPDGTTVGNGMTCPSVQCPDGTTVGNGMTCPPVQCPDGTTVGNGMTCPPVQCPDGTTVGNGMTCPPVQCPDGTTVGNGMTCPPVQCPDGTTVGNGMTCPPVQCPDGTTVGNGMTCPPVQCPDGTTVGNGMTCPSVQCPDGTTVGNGMTCPPVQCPDGTTVGNGMTCPPVQCPDGTTVGNGMTCPSVQCPDGTTVGNGMTCPSVQCPDGTTVGNGMTCPPVQCPDGTTVGNGMTCPPVQCPDGTTVGNGMTCPPVQCPDGTTVGNGMTCPPVQCPDGTTVGNGMTCSSMGSREISLPPDYSFFGSSKFRLEPGGTTERGVLRFSCEGSVSCEVSIDAANDVARFTGGTVSATQISAPLIASSFLLGAGEHWLVRLPESDLLHVVACGHISESCDIRDFRYDHAIQKWVWRGTNHGHLLVATDTTGFFLAKGEEITATYPNGRTVTFGCQLATGCGMGRTFLDAQGNPTWEPAVVYDEYGRGSDATPWGSPVAVAQDGVRITPAVEPDPGTSTGVTRPVNTVQFDFPEELPDIAVDHWELTDSYIGGNDQRLETVCPGLRSNGDICSVGSRTFTILDVMNRAHKYGIEVMTSTDNYGYVSFRSELARKLELALKSPNLTEEEREELSFTFLGSWGQHSAFGKLILPHSIVDPGNIEATSHRYALGHLYYGFPDPLANESGTATWRGPWGGEFTPWNATSGKRDFTGTRPTGIFSGESTIIYDFAGRDVDVTLLVLESYGQIVMPTFSEAEYPGNPTISWEGIPQNHDGSFFLQGNHKKNTPLELGGSGYIDGDFYGPNAEEVAGIFERVSGGYHLIGAFGGKREVE